MKGKWARPPPPVSNRFIVQHFPDGEFYIFFLFLTSAVLGVSSPPSPYRNRNKKNIDRQTDNSPVSNNNFFFFLIFNAQVNFIYYIEEQEEGDIGWEGKGIFLTMDVCVCVVERCDEIIIVKNIIIIFFSKKKKI